MTENAEDIITATSLLQEIEPLVRELFLASINLSDEKLTLSFSGGQRFEITANEI